MSSGFFIPTPVGNYNPDWSIVFNEGEIKHIYFIAETKGMLDSFKLRTDDIEKAKIHCAKEHFKSISSASVKYEAIASYEHTRKKEEGGIQKGRQEGIQEEKEKIAINLLQEGIEIALVAKATGLSKDEVEKLRE